ncbi:glycosyltransferase [Amycolatopsis sp. CA-126428]|uniref:glycosyltransferase n=1 Tax=Amycolatopsis sp. CA-126428 TaxID=2073158 RepID=UPI0035173873
MPPLTGHVNPTVGVAEELRVRGHEVAFAGDLITLAALVPAVFPRYPCDCLSAVDRPPGVRGFTALKFLWEEFLIPLAEAMMPGVLRAVGAFAPDVLVVDQQTFAGALVAERLGIPWATSATTSSELTDPLAEMPKIRLWRDELLEGLRRRFGDPRAGSDLRFSPFLVLAFTVPEMLEEWSRPEMPVSFVGVVPRSGGSGPSAGTLPPPELGKPLVFVSLGTANALAGRRFLDECVAALTERSGIQAIVVDPTRSRRDAGAVLIRPRVAQLMVLHRASAVVCHGGHNTVCEALSLALPLVIAPIRDDQMIVADQVTRVGAGVRLRFDRARAPEIGAAVDRILTRPSYRDAAARIRTSFAAAGGAREAADRLALLTATHPSPR